MIKTMKSKCPWCSKDVHAVLSHGVWQGECSVCADVFTVDIPMPTDALQMNLEVTEND